MPEVEVYHPNLDIYAHPVVSFNLKGVHSHDVAQFLGDQNICVRAGHHCAQLLHRSVFQVNSSVRVSLSIYNSKEEIDSLISILKNCAKKFGIER
jgi:cysteine desulfurase/selenocysteine lyase